MVTPDALEVSAPTMKQTKPKKGQFMNFSQGHSGTKVQNVNRACFPKEKHTRIHLKMGEIHELFVLALALVWFAGATPDILKEMQNVLLQFQPDLAGAELQVCRLYRL